MFTLPTTSTPPVLVLLVELLTDDKRAGIPWSAEDYGQRVDLAVRVTRAGTIWRRVLIESYPVWKDAYLDRVGGALERWDPRTLAA